jgi:hypothetical protein
MIHTRVSIGVLGIASCDTQGSLDQTVGLEVKFQSSIHTDAIILRLHREVLRTLVITKWLVREVICLNKEAQLRGNGIGS